MKQYKDIKGYEGRYRVSTNGDVISYNRKTRTGKDINPKILKFGIDNYGYPIVGLYKDGVRKTKPVHRLVAETFLSNPNKKETVNHIDGDKLNNSIWNLEWSTREENQSHAIDNKLHCFGEKHGCSKLTEGDVLIIRTVRNKYPQIKLKHLAEIFNTTLATISYACNGDTWKHLNEECVCYISESILYKIHNIISKGEVNHMAKRPVKMMDLDGKELNMFPSVTDARNFLGKTVNSAITRACSGVLKTAYGYKWEYVC